MIYSFLADLIASGAYAGTAVLSDSTAVLILSAAADWLSIRANWYADETGTPVSDAQWDVIEGWLGVLSDEIEGAV